MYIKNKKWVGDQFRTYSFVQQLIRDKANKMSSCFYKKIVRNYVIGSFFEEAQNTKNEMKTKK